MSTQTIIEDSDDEVVQQPVAKLTNNDEAVTFAGRWFSGCPGYIHTSWEKRKETGDEVHDKQNYSAAEKLRSSRWNRMSDTHAIMYCVSTVQESDSSNRYEDCAATPGVWVDIDVAKRLSYDVNRFYQELKSSEDASCYVRSSDKGIQVLWKLDEPVVWNGKKEVFDKKLRPLLVDLCYYFGGDPLVCKGQNLMRLPGSVNRKPDYGPNGIQVRQQWTDSTYRYSQLIERFFIQHYEDHIPVALWAEIEDAIDSTGMMEPTSGMRHQFSLWLTGTLRKGNLDVEAGKKRLGGLSKRQALALVKRIGKRYADDDRAKEVETTYAADPSKTDADGRSIIATLQSAEETREAGRRIALAVEEWVKLNVWYCKEKGLKHETEWVDPTKEEATGQPFTTESRRTTYHDAKGGPAPFSNFVLLPKDRLIKAETTNTVWRCTLQRPGLPDRLIEVSGEHLISPAHFEKIRELGAGTKVFLTSAWAQYVGWLEAQFPREVVRESTFYGILNAKEGKPTLLLPGEEHPAYSWTGSGVDTASQGIYSDLREQDPELVRSYLSNLARYMPIYHTPTYVWPMLGMLAAAPLAGIVRARFKGFPTLMIHGLSGSGKSQLIHEVFANHIGSRGVAAYGATTPFSMKRYLISNNLVPLIIDEFRDGQDQRSAAFQEIIRNLYDSSAMSSGRANGDVVTEKLVASAIVSGEHQYMDSATIQRTILVQLDRSFIKAFRESSPESLEEHSAAVKWLHDTKHQGKAVRCVLNWFCLQCENNPERINKILDNALSFVKETCPTTVERKVYGYAALLFGIKIWMAMLKDYKVSYSWPIEEIPGFLYGGDPTITKGYDSHDAPALQTLFSVTDSIIMDARRTGRSYCGFLYHCEEGFDPQMAVFDVNRWQTALMQSGLLRGDSATLVNPTAFYAFLKDAASRNDTPVIDVDVDHGQFSVRAVRIDLHKVRETYRINTEQWGNEPVIKESDLNV